jgi:hypothetical protein
MAHTKAEDLADLSNELQAVRDLQSIKEKSVGIFYFKAVPFLHFHDEDGARWADLKIGSDWVKLKIDFKATKAKRAAFLKQVSSAHSKMLRIKK